MIKNNNQDSIWWVSVPWVILGTAANISLVKLTVFLDPWGLYFKYSKLLYDVGDPDTLSPWAIPIKFSIPVVVGILLGIFLSKNPKGTAGCSGFLASTLLVWPALWYWTTIIPPEIQDKRLAFHFVYSLYILANTFLAIMGAGIGNAVANWYNAHSKQLPANIVNSIAKAVIRELFDWKGTLKPAILAVITSVAATLIANYFSNRG